MFRKTIQSTHGYPEPTTSQGLTPPDRSRPSRWERWRPGGRLSSRNFIACLARAVHIVIRDSTYSETRLLSDVAGVRERS